jgi:hypothetical protein
MEDGVFNLTLGNEASSEGSDEDEDEQWVIYYKSPFSPTYKVFLPSPLSELHFSQLILVVVLHS